MSHSKSPFVAVVLGLFLIPGPAVLLVLSRTVQAGRKTGIMTGLGVATGEFVTPSLPQLA
jgi:threonine/homoserine/homoserine lactone efflux protein